MVCAGPVFYGFLTAVDVSVVDGVSVGGGFVLIVENRYRLVFLALDEARPLLSKAIKNIVDVSETLPLLIEVHFVLPVGTPNIIGAEATQLLMPLDVVSEFLELCFVAMGSSLRRRDS